MRVSTPIAVLTAQTNAARQGIIIRSGQALEALAYVDTIIFDKTATLTEGEAKIVAVEIEDERRSVSDLISLAASAEQALGHPIAESIVRYAHAHHIELRPCADWNYCAGLGIEAQIDGQLINVGNRRYMKQLGVAVHDLDGPQQNSKLDPATRVYVAADGQLLGIITCADPLRPQVAAIIAHLKSEGITPYLVSGDSQAVTSHVAEEVGINSKHVYAEMLPQQKLALVKSLQDQGRRVAFIGDGINDAAAMAHADVSITLNSATDLALETAGIVLTQNKLTDLLITLELSRHAMHIIGQNKALVIVPNVGGILYATLTVMNPIAGVVINNGSAAAAALNSLRPLAGPKKKRREKEKMPNLGHLQLRKIENGEL